MKKSPFLAVIGTILLLGACTSGVIMREEVAQRLAAPAWMLKREIPAAPFALTAYERMHERGAPARVYIEGDGLAWLTKKQPSLNPTPKNPLALHLASKDNAENLAWLARPCQYSGMLDRTQPCDAAYWTGKRYAPEVLAAYNTALDEMKARYGLTGFELVGFSGGGTVAALLAAQRDDVLSLRTVAGNLDHRAHSDIHQVSILEGSLNPPDYAAKLAAVPQVHFTGEFDEIVPEAVLDSYLQALGDTSCVRHEIVKNAAHEEGWVNRWPELLKITPRCEFAPTPAMDFEPLEMPEPIRTTREIPVKP